MAQDGLGSLFGLGRYVGFNWRANLVKITACDHSRLPAQECQDFSAQEEHTCRHQGAHAIVLADSACLHLFIVAWGLTGPCAGILQGVQLRRHIEATLGSGNVSDAVRLPPGEDLNEWLAVNTVDFYNAVSILYGTLAEFCTEKSCEVMSASAKVDAAGSCTCKHASKQAALLDCCCMCR
jgi:hypothetical protein